ncbi:isochorismate synthase [Parabacteroides sp. ZJ-118]|uniref:isochorismate synthase n=1 Tax=Parabacteroides sp. ZJ-118 TaxID=2709398 RepID=UPI0013EDC509|nr:isochorismate synthase [Parabacteroides sp. ZJ-118]
MISKEAYERIDTLIERGRNFAIWRVPGEGRLHFRMQSAGSPCLLYDIKDLNERSGFVIAPFQVTAERPIVLIQPDVFEPPSARDEELIMKRERAQDDPSPFPAISPSLGEASESEEKERYARYFSLFTHPLLKGSQDKLVLSRSKTIRRDPAFSPGKAFFAAVERYTRSYVYLCHTPETGTWMGGTPEILLSGGKGDWQTVALAGTQTLRDGKLPRSWDPKNWREQQLVAAYIRRQLSALGITPEEKGPYSARAGEVSHLRSDFFFSLPDPEKLGDVLHLLHPTPAVCGLPKEEAYRFIIGHEGYDRSYYSGFIGWLDPEGKTDLYVNLRCMNIHPQALTLYAGGGLLAASRLEDEWQETEAKLDTMRRLLREIQTRKLSPDEDTI